MTGATVSVAPVVFASPRDATAVSLRGLLVNPEHTVLVSARLALFREHGSVGADQLDADASQETRKPRQ